MGDQSSLDQQQLQAIAQVLQSGEQDIARMENIEEEQLQRDFQIHQQVDQRVGQVENDLETVSELIADYLQDKGVSENRFEEYLDNPNKLRQDLQTGLNLDNPQAIQQMESDISQLEQELQQDLAAEHSSYQELMNALQENRAVLQEFRQMQQSIEQTASDDLKPVLNEFTDRQTWQNTGINYNQQAVQLAEQFLAEYGKFQQLEQMEEQLAQKIQQNEMQEIREVEKRIERLAEIVSLLEEAVQQISGGQGSGEKDRNREWRDLLSDPQSHIDPRSGIGIKRDQLVPYDPKRWCAYPNPRPKYNTPEQGFKFHITATPKDGYEVCKELIPILQANGIRHKIIKSKEWMERRISNKGDIQAMKLMTIYPGIGSGSPNKQVFKPGNTSQNKKAFFINENHTREILRNLINKSDRSILNGGPKLEGERDFFSVEFNAEEYRVGNTRIHLTYSIVGHMDRYVVANGNKYSITDWVLKKDNKGNYIQINHSLYYKLWERNFRESGTYRSDCNYKDSDYFLSHLLGKNKAKEVKKGLGGRFGPNTYQEDAIIGLDGKIAGAHYLPPPEAIERMKKTVNSIL